MSECLSNLCCVNWGIDEYGGVKTGLECECRAHAVFTHMTAAFVEASDFGEHATGATSQASTADVAERGTGETIVTSVGDGAAGAVKTEWLKHNTCIVIYCEGVVPSMVSQLVQDIYWEFPFAGVGCLGVAYLVLFTDIADDGLSFGLDGDVSGIDDRGMGNDAVRHGVGGDVGFVVADVGNMRSLLGLVVTEDYGSMGRGRGDVRDELRVCVD